jgi:hypothetical protein
MKHFKLYNNIIGWISFAIAAATYLLTMEPTASFWDCGEFLSSAYRLEVGHPPGAPFFMLMGRFFSLFATETTYVAMCINALSAMCSAFSILFLFWTITHLGRKLLVKNGNIEEISLGQGFSILGAGLVGALAYTFSDTFWFSAVEGEVYAFSSLLTAVTFWLILKWEDADEKDADRWIILIAYLMGLSIGVHLLNLLVIPAIVLVFYFKKFNNYSFKGILIALLSSGVILGCVLYGLIPGCIKVASWVELLCVNGFGMPYNSGLIVYLLLVAGVLGWAVFETISNKNRIRMLISVLCAFLFSGIVFFGDGAILGILLIAILAAFFFYFKEKISARWLNTIVMCIAVIMIGYSSYALIVIRSLANTPMDQNSPDDIFSLQYYLNREQYGDRPLIYGPVYSAPEKLVIEDNYCIPVEKKGGKIWDKVEKDSPEEKDRYVVTGIKHKGYEMDSRFNIFFPRMYKGASVNEEHIKAYEEWGKVKGRDIIVDRCGKKEIINKPTFVENMRFFFRYQLNFMYWRYFMWNFSGRQNDLQGYGEVDKGNWITGISWIDTYLVGNQDNLPEDLANNKGHNRYYMLPLLLGIIGLFYQIGKGREGQKSFWVTFMFFFLTGIAIVIYLNQTPYQPRERDYAYAGSFYAFSIWIGLGVFAISQFFEKIIKNKPISAIVATLLCLGVPTLIASENWDDHDRSERTVCRDFGSNYLMSCPKNAIIFTNGDNDTFPLWYNQEVEGNRTDIRVCNLSYLQASWYIDQMKREAYESAPLPISWDHSEYRTGVLDMARVSERYESLTLDQALRYLRHPKTIDENGIGSIPTKQLILPIDSQQVIKTQTVDSANAHRIDSMMVIKLRRGMSKADLMVLEMINTNKWERPIYFAVTVGENYYPAVNEYFQLEGLAYRLVPIKTEENSDRVNTEVMYDNMMNKFRWGGIEKEGVYLDETVLRMCRTQRLMFCHLIDALLKEGKEEKARKALNRCLEVIPFYNVPADYSSIMLATAFYKLGEIKEGDKIMNLLVQNSMDKIDWALTLPSEWRASISRENSINQNLAILQAVYSECDIYNKSLAEKIYKDFERVYLKSID